MVGMQTEIDLQDEADLASISMPHPSPVAFILGLAGAISGGIVIARFLLWTCVG